MIQIEIQGLSKKFYLHHVGAEVQGCQDVNIEVKAGEFIGITGKSGSGKSTILRCIYRTYLPEKGKILYTSPTYGKLDLATVNERLISVLRRDEIAYVSQFLQILPRTTAIELIIQSALEVGYQKEQAEEEAKKILRHFEIKEELWQLYPNTFSGGEKLRLNIAKAMIKKPILLLLDEPTASLDDSSKLRVRELLEQLKETKTTMIGIFHDLSFMEGICDREYKMGGE